MDAEFTKRNLIKSENHVKSFSNRYEILSFICDTKLIFFGINN